MNKLAANSMTSTLGETKKCGLSHLNIRMKVKMRGITTSIKKKTNLFRPRRLNERFAQQKSNPFEHIAEKRHVCKIRNNIFN